MPSSTTHRLSKKEFDTMVKNAPEGTTSEGIVNSLHAKGWKIDGVDKDAGREAAKGALKGLGSSILSVGKLGMNAMDKLFGIKPSKELAAGQATLEKAVTPTNTAQKVGFAGEQIAEFFTPAGWVGRAGKGLEAVSKISQVSKAEKWLSKLPAIERAGARLAESPAARKIAQVAEKVATKAAESPLVRNTAKDVAVAGAQSDFNPAAMAGAAIVGPVLSGVGRLVKTPLTWAAEKLYQSALKPSTKLAKDDVKKIVSSALEHKLFVTNGGVEKLGEKIDMFEKQLGGAIDEATKAGKKVSLDGLQGYVDEAKKFFTNAFDVKAAKNAVKELDGLVKSFVKEHGKDLAPDVAQKIKVTTMRAVRKYYGELSGASIEGQKQGARYLKDQIIKLTGGAADDINKRLGALYELDQQLNRAVNRSGNVNILGMGTKAGALAGAGAAAITGDLKAGAVAALGVAADILDRAGVKSSVAVGVNELGKFLSSTAQKGRIPAVVLISKILEQITAEQEAQTQTR